MICALTVAIVGSSSLASAGSVKAHMNHAPVVLVRDKNGNPVASLAHQLVSENWSGYVLSKISTKKSYTSASSTWVVPAVTYDGIEAISANWVGIGGFCKDKKCNQGDKTLIQLGTFQAAIGDSDLEYVAWYELIPASSVEIGTLNVSPGDTITASLSCAGKCKKKQAWTLSMTDVTTGDSWSQVFNYKSSKLSAEWIEEAPSSGGGIEPLADFDKSVFSESVANGTSANLDSAFSLVMEDSDGSSHPCSESPSCQTSNVSEPNSTMDGFAACFSPNSTLASCVDN